jgi:hypothetical protein
MVEARKGARIIGAARDKLAAELGKKYQKGRHHPRVGERTSSSYRGVHLILSESGVVLRGRGRTTRRGKK